MNQALRQTIALAWMRALPGTRNRISYALVFMFPMMFVPLYTIVGGTHMTRHVLIGALVAFLSSNAIVALPQTMVEYKRRKLQDVFVASPIHPFVYLFGLGLSRLIYAAPGLLLLVVVLLVTGSMSISALPLVGAVLLVSWITGCAIGFTVATYIESPMQISAVANLLGLVMNVLPPVLYPLDLIPANWQRLVLAFPSASSAHLIRVSSHATALGDVTTVLICCGVLAFYAVVGLLLVTYKSQWRAC